MKEQIISFKTAKLAKKKGFEEKCLFYYDLDDKSLSENSITENLFKTEKTSNYYDIGGCPSNRFFKYTFPSKALKSQNKLERLANEKDDDLDDELIYADAPTQSLLQKWLREKHNLIVYLLPNIEIGSINEWEYQISKYENNHTQSNRFELNEINGTYEEALEKGLQKALKLIK